MSDQKAPRAGNLDVDLSKDVFMRSMLRALTGVLEDVVGLAEAEGYVSVVGRRSIAAPSQLGARPRPDA